MDPNAAVPEVYRILRDLQAALEASKPDEAKGLVSDLSFVWSGLDEWLGKGGFLPDAWNKQTLVWTLSEEDEKRLYRDLDRARTFRVSVDWGTFKWDGGNGWVAGIDPDNKKEA